MIKRYLQFLNEANDTEGIDGIKSLSKDKYSELIDELKSMIDNTIDSSGGEFNSFIDSFPCV